MSRKLFFPVALVAALLLPFTVVAGAPEPTAHADAGAHALAPPPGGLVPSRSWGWSEGSFSVSHDGAAEYRLPLWVPPGRGGVQPDLALTYNSRSGNGPVGVGWTLSGLSSVTPCARTLAQDGFVDPVHYNGFDAYCLDGVRLRVVGVPSGVETEYRTERDMFARITSSGVPGAVPASFTVFTKDGRIMRYGQSEQSRLRAYRLSAGSGNPDQPSLVRSASQVTAGWALDRIEDRNGNVATVTYDQDTGSEADLWYAHLRPRSIVYGPNRSVVLDYEDRTDDVDSFNGGIHTRATQRLRQISMFGRATPTGATQRLRQYRLSYLNTSTTKRSLLTSVTECDLDSVCLKPLQFGWSMGSYDVDVIDTGITDAGTSNDSGRRILTGDVSGDGRDDIIYPDAANNLRMRFADANGFSPYITDTLPPRPYVDPQRTWDYRPIDIDRDGQLDLMAETLFPDDSAVEYALFQSIGHRFTRYAPDVDEEHISVDQGQNDPAYFVDLDGNGMPDYVTPRMQVPTNTPIHYRLNTGAEGASRFGPMRETTYDPASTAQARMKTLDSDGDGRAELLMHNNAPTNHYETFGLNQFGAVRITPVNLLANAAGFDLHLADVNGDGLQDAIYPLSGLRAQLNSGNGFGPIVAGPTAYQNPQGPFLSPVDHGIRVVDYNNDGRDDVLVFHDGVPTGPADHQRGMQLYTWSETGFVRVPLNRALDREPEPGPNDLKAWQSAQPFDFEGDGVTDLVYVEDGAPDHLQILKRRGGLSDKLVSVGVGGVGPRFEVDYASLAKGGLNIPHVPGDCAGAFPLVCPTQGGSVVLQHRVAAVDEAGATVWNRFDHRYQHARVDVSGRGWLGMARHVVNDRQTDRSTVTDFDNETRIAVGPSTVFPYAGLPKVETTHLPLDADTVARTEVTNTPALRPLAVPGTYTVELPTTITKEWEYPSGAPLPATPLRTRTTSRAYDAFGNQTDVTQRVTGGRSLREILTYDNLQDDWLIGQLRRRLTTACTSTNVCNTRETTHIYDEQGNPEETVVEPTRPGLRLTTHIDRGDFGTVAAVTMTDGANRSRRDEFEYDADALLPTATTNALDHRTTTAYHSGLGVAIGTTDANGVETTMRYDKFGRLRETNRANGAFERLDHTIYFGVHAISTEVAGGGGGLTLLDMLGHEIEVGVKSFGGSLAFTRTRFDRFGRPASVSRPYLPGEALSFTTNQYDNRDRITRTTAPDGAVVRNDYDRLETRTFDARNVQTRVVQTLDGDVESRYEGSLRTRFEYGPFGETTKMVAPDGTTQTLEYDVLGRRVRHTDPTTGRTDSTYDAFHDLVTETDAEGRVTTYENDALGRVTRTASPDGVGTSTWDTAEHGIGLLASARSADGIVTAHEYDDVGQNVSSRWVVDGTTYRIDRGFALGRPTTLTFPQVPGVADRLAVNYEYNASGYLLRVRDAAAGTPYWQADDRNAAAQLTRERLGNGVVTDYSYNVVGLPSRTLTTGPAPVGTLDDLRLTYDPNRNVQSRFETVSNRRDTYAYDTLNRLTSWRLQHGSTVDATTAFAYNSSGNLTSETVAGHPERNATYTYGGPGAPPHALTARNSTPYGYDGAGRQTTGAQRTITYNQADMPKSIVWGQSQRTVFAYDAEGFRVRKSDDGQTVTSVPGIFERRVRAGTGNTEIHNLHNIVVEGRTVAQVNRVQATPTGPITFTRMSYLHTDQQGSTTLVTNSAGRPADDDDFLGALYYDPFGRRIKADGTPLGRNRNGGPRQGFTGHEHADEYGLVDLTSRMFDPEQRRFLTPDPLIEAPMMSQTHNRYAYVSNNPATRVDPTGLFGTPVFAWAFPELDAESSTNRAKAAMGDDEDPNRRNQQAGSDASGAAPENPSTGAPDQDDDGNTDGVQTQAGEVIEIRGKKEYCKEPWVGFVGQWADEPRFDPEAFMENFWQYSMERERSRNTLDINANGRIGKRGDLAAENDAAIWNGGVRAGKANVFGAMGLNNDVNAATLTANMGDVFNSLGGGLRAGKQPVIVGKAAAVRGGAGPGRQGRIGVERTVKALQEAGGRVIGREITLDVNGVRTRIDLYVQLPNGARIFVEVKTGPKAGFTPNQTAAFPGIWQGGMAVPVGAQAKAAGLPVGQTLGPTPVITVRQPWP